MTRSTRRIGTPTRASAWLASISEPSIASGTTSVAPAARSRSKSASSMVRTTTGSGGLAHAIGVEIEGDVGDLLGLEQSRQVLAAATEAADDDVAFGVDRAPR